MQIQVGGGFFYTNSPSPNCSIYYRWTDSFYNDAFDGQYSDLVNVTNSEYMALAGSSSYKVCHTSQSKQSAAPFSFSLSTYTHRYTHITELIFAT